MANTVKLAPDLYSAPPKTAIPGARLDYRVIALLTTDIVTTQIVALAVIPAGHRLDYFRIESDALDTGSAIRIDVGLLNSYYNSPVAAVGNVGWDGGTSPVLAAGYKIISASNLPIAAGGGFKTQDATIQMSTLIGVDKIHDRILAFQFSTAPSVAVAGNVAFICGIDED